MKEIAGIIIGGILVLTVIAVHFVPDPGHDEGGYVLLLIAAAAFALFYFYYRRRR
ncbi:hypothetical protein [Candidatus Tokpelaia sp.]|uniref:hypothetical protein n=1 Tax=Candidatus Tokpelaia sp. TaxID=2233777 RepID=UPI001681A77A|nr:hypothetical protein [Candidatus Tokpelaia sp.]